MFFITGIIGFSLTILGVLVIPAEKGESKVADRRLDVFGMACFTLGIIGVIFYLSEGPAAGWSSALPLSLLIVGVVLLVSFVVIEHKIAYPIMPLHIWHSRRLIASCATTICMMAGLNGHFFFSSLTFQNVLMYSPLKTSFAYITHGVGSILAVVVLGFVMKRVRTKIVLMVGWVFFLGSAVVWAQIKVESSYWSIPFPALILNFIGMASIWLCCQLNSVADAADEDQGVVGAGTSEPSLSELKHYCSSFLCQLILTSTLFLSFIISVQCVHADRRSYRHCDHQYNRQQSQFRDRCWSRAAPWLPRRLLHDCSHRWCRHGGHYGPGAKHRQRQDTR